MVSNPKLIECPRDAIQGIKHFIPTEKKIEYINFLLELNIFDTIDFGSFVSPKAIPQMADTQKVVDKLMIQKDGTKLLAIIANIRGAIEAAKNKNISLLGYPFSVSETFQNKNTNSTRWESLENLKIINEICVNNNKDLVVYLSMAFGNPYSDEWNAEIVIDWLEKIKKLGITKISLADTTGMATEKSMTEICEKITAGNMNIEIGLHLHTLPMYWQKKIEIATAFKINRFDGAILGYGGCPMAQDDLVGNMPMENLLHYFQLADEILINEIKERFLWLISTK